MDKKRAVLIMLCIILGVVLVIICTRDPYIKKTSQTSTIKVSSGTFDCSVDKLIDILNKDIKKEKLGRIPKDYEIRSHRSYTEYRCKINNRFMIRFVKYKTEGEGIVRAGISYLYEGEYTTCGKTAKYVKSKKGKKKAVKYYEIMCRNIDPRFKAKHFCEEYGLADTGTFELDDLIFFGNAPAYSADEIEETLLVYEVISSNDLYKKYKESILEDDEIFFR